MKKVGAMSASEIIGEFIELKVYLSNVKRPNFRYHPIFDPKLKHAKKRIKKLSQRIDQIVKKDG